MGRQCAGKKKKVQYSAQEGKEKMKDRTKYEDLEYSNRATEEDKRTRPFSVRQ